MFRGIYNTPACSAGGGGMKSASRDHRRHPLGSDRCESTFGFCERPMRVTTVDDHCRFFFQHFFDDFEFFDFSEKGYWARCFGKAFWVVRGGPGEHLGASGGGPGGVLGGPGAVRGGSGGRLGRVLGALGAILGRSLRQSDFGSIFRTKPFEKSQFASKT